MFDFQQPQSVDSTRFWASWLVAVVLCLSPTLVFAQGHEGHSGHEDHSAHEAMLSKGASSEAAPGATPTKIPDLKVFDQNGDPVRFYSDLVAGKKVAMNFVFTTCRTICPPMGANFGKLQKLLGDRLGDDVFLISVSVDPTIDTPARMKAWGEKFGRGDGWTLVTGPKSDVDILLKSLGAFTPDKTDHAPLVLVGDDGAGKWRRVNGLAPPAKVVEALEALAPKPDHDEHHGHGAHNGGDR